MSTARRNEMLLLLLVACTVALGAALVCVGMDYPFGRVARALAVVGAVITAAMMLDLADPGRDRYLLPLAAMLCGWGFLLLWQLNEQQAARQVIWMITGAGMLVAVYYLIEDVRDLARLKYTAGVGGVLLMVLTMIYGIEAGGAKLWLGVSGLLTFQPVEIVKVLMCIFVAGYIADRAEMLAQDTSRVAGVAIPRARHIAPLLLIVAFSLAIFVYQRDLGAAVLFFGLFVTMVYLATGRKSFVGVAMALFAAGGVGAYYGFSHVANRVDMWINPWQAPTEGGYQILQGLFALGEGGILGRGFASGGGASIPAATTDMVFAVGAEQLGLIGAVGLLIVLAMMAFVGYSIAWRSTDRFGTLLAAGLATVFSLQTLVIVGGVTKLIPLTGITLPFVSYGGTSVVVNFIALALLLVVSRDCIPRRSGEE